MFYNLSTVGLRAGYGVSHAISQLRVKREAAVWSSQFPREQHPFTGSDWWHTGTIISTISVKKWLQRTVEYT